MLGGLILLTHTQVYHTLSFQFGKRNLRLSAFILLTANKVCIPCKARFIILTLTGSESLQFLIKFTDSKSSSKYIYCMCVRVRGLILLTESHKNYALQYHFSDGKFCVSGFITLCFIHFYNIHKCMCHVQQPTWNISFTCIGNQHVCALNVGNNKWHLLPLL